MRPLLWSAVRFGRRLFQYFHVPGERGIVVLQLLVFLAQRFPFDAVGQIFHAVRCQRGFDLDGESQAVVHEPSRPFEHLYCDACSGYCLNLLHRHMQILGSDKFGHIVDRLFQSGLLGLLQHHGLSKERRFRVTHHVRGLGFNHLGISPHGPGGRKPEPDGNA